MWDSGQDWVREAERLGATSLTVAAIDWSRGLNPARPWVPEALLPLNGCDSYVRLTPAQRLAYNHAYAAQLLEEFIWIESRLIVAPLEALHAGQGSDAAAVIASFLADERSHIACFTQLRALTGIDDVLFTPPGDLTGAATLAGRWPQQFTFWTNVIAAFEQYALDIGKHYKDDTALDPLFRDVFVAHARDEARHCRFDALLQSRLAAGAVNSRIGAFFSRAYYATDWGLDGPVRHLARAFPELAGDERALHTAARIARHRKHASPS